MDTSLETVKQNLFDLEYFKYVKKDDLPAVVEKTFEGYKGDGEIGFPAKGLNRIFAIDAENIYEGDGIKNQITGMQDLFEAMGINISLGEYIEEFDNDTAAYTKRTIQINGKVYDTSNASDWETAFKSGIKLVDEILKDLGKAEKVFGLFMDEMSILIILTEAQYQYLTDLIPEDSEFRPIHLP